MGNIKVTIANKDPHSIKKIYRNLPESFYPVAIIRVYITKPQKPVVYGLLIVGHDIEYETSSRFYVVNGNMLHQEHLYYNTLLEISSMIVDMYSSGRFTKPSKYSDFKVPSRSLDMRVPVQRF